MSEDWRRIDRGLFESADGHWRIANPWKLTTELCHRWVVAERRASGSGWCMHDGDHATLQDARSYVEALSDSAPTVQRAGCEPEAPMSCQRGVDAQRPAPSAAQLGMMQPRGEASGAVGRRQRHGGSR
jgi:hypothetical protein